jgi:hypothetical protein
MEAMSANKARLFTHPLELEPYILNNFHPYFHAEEVIKEWFHLLILAHKFHAYEYHDMVRALKSASPEDISAEATIQDAENPWMTFLSCCLLNSM